KFLADGGSNRVYDAFKHDQQTLNKGDLDSIRPDVKDFYASKNVKITRVSDQDSTDFMKCVDLLREKEAQDHKTYDIVAMPALGGRFDQTMASINLLYFLKNEKDRRTILVSDESLTVLLDKGKHHIHCQPEYEGPTCGVMPIGAPAILTTKGLRWNLENYECFFGGMVSTSNVIDSKLIEIDTNSPVVWTIEINLQK
ncbi:thiamine pyrophosphokinase, partial [Radiomyces spectabilis]|uniref:thiamine pyrophosphokinase n=1 Tax=Radiomyces spectabilis TaxID=64574 RepID=UPI0022209304